MASRSFGSVLRSSLIRQLVLPASQRRAFSIAITTATARAGVVATKAAPCGPIQQTRGVRTIDFAGHKEKVYGNVYCPLSRSVELLTS